MDKPTDESEEDDDEFISALKETVRKVKVSREMGALYMIWEEELEDAFAEGKAEGEAVTKRIFRLHLAGQSEEEIAEVCEVSIEKVQEILN